MLGEGGKVDALQGGGERVVDRDEGVMKRTWCAYPAPSGAEWTTADVPVTLEEFDDFQNRDRGGITREAVSAAGTPAAFDDSVTGKLGQYLGDEWLREVAACGDLCGVQVLIRRMNFCEGTDCGDRAAAHFSVSEHGWWLG